MKLEIYWIHCVYNHFVRNINSLKYDVKFHCLKIRKKNNKERLSCFFYITTVWRIDLYSHYKILLQ